MYNKLYNTYRYILLRLTHQAKQTQCIADAGDHSQLNESNNFSINKTDIVIYYKDLKKNRLSVTFSEVYSIKNEIRNKITYMNNPILNAQRKILTDF